MKEKKCTWRYTMLTEAWLFFTALVWWEYAIVVVLVVALIFAEANENSFSFLVGFGLFMFYPWSTTGSLFSNVGITGSLFWLLIYIVIGIIWSRFKWGRLLDKLVEQKNKEYEAQTENHPDDMNYFDREYAKNKEEYLKKQIQEEKDINRFVYWISSWPISAFVYFFGEMIADSFRKLVSYLSVYYTRIGDKKVERVLAKENKNKE